MPWHFEENRVSRPWFLLLALYFSLLSVSGCAASSEDSLTADIQGLFVARATASTIEFIQNRDGFQTELVFDATQGVAILRRLQISCPASPDADLDDEVFLEIQDIARIDLATGAELRMEDRTRTEVHSVRSLGNRFALQCGTGLTTRAFQFVSVEHALAYATLRHLPLPNLDTYWVNILPQEIGTLYVQANQSGQGVGWYLTPYSDRPGGRMGLLLVNCEESYLLNAAHLEVEGRTRFEQPFLDLPAVDQFSLEIPMGTFTAADNLVWGNVAIQSFCETTISRQDESRRLDRLILD